MIITISKKDGKVTLEKSLDLVFNTLKNGVYTLEIKRKTEPRTISQNALMWMWFTCMEDETGQSKEDIHDYYCKKFLWRDIEIKGKIERVYSGTKNLNTMEFRNFLNYVQADAATEFGISLPSPEDRFYQEFVDQYRHR